MKKGMTVEQLLRQLEEMLERNEIQLHYDVMISVERRVPLKQVVTSNDGHGWFLDLH